MYKVPLSRGGLHQLDNVWIVHQDANRAKSTFTVDEFIAICAEVYRNTQAKPENGGRVIAD